MKNVARELMNFGELIENDHTPVQEPNMMQEEHRSHEPPYVPYDAHHEQGRYRIELPLPSHR